MERRRSGRNAGSRPFQAPGNPPLNEPLPFAYSSRSSLSHFARFSPSSRFERVDVLPAAAHQLELAVDVAERLLEDLAAAAGARVALAPLGAQRGARLLGLEQRLELVEAEAEQLLEAEGVAESRSTSASS